MKKKKSGVGQLAVPVGVVLIVMMMVVPIPTMLLDFLIATNITFALVIVLTSMYVQRVLDFSSFPSLLLVLTLFRLALNISATRLVLSKGYAGKVIAAFGHFVVGGSLIVGLVIFLILLVVQFVVITNGSARIAEVGARFTLDAMPGKQMAIDADLNSGVIDEPTARLRRSEITAEADFYGSMDGATRFVKGDAIASIIITIINMVGGITIGVLQRGMSVTDALNSYSLMSVGDGLVSQIPALLLSVSTGLIVTRSSASDDMGTVVARQLSGQRRALQIAGGAALVLCLVPGMPTLPFVTIGLILVLLAARSKPTIEVEQELAVAEAPSPDSPLELLMTAAVDPLELALAHDLVSLVDGPGADLLERVKALRRSVVRDVGLIMPAVRTRDDITLPASTYSIRVNGIEVTRGQSPVGMVLAIGDGLEGLPGRAGREPVFGLEGKWLSEELRPQAELLGATVIDRPSVIITHLSEVVRNYASRLLGREEVAALVTSVRRSHPTVIEDLTPSLLTLGEIQRTLHGLLDERVPIRDLIRIFEALATAGKAGTDPDRLVEAGRESVAAGIVAANTREGRLDVITVDPRLQQTMLESLRPADGGAQFLLPAGLAERLMDSVQLAYRNATESGHNPVIVCAPQIRRALRRLIKMAVPDLPVLSFTELTAGNARVETVGEINDVRDAVT